MWTAAGLARRCVSGSDVKARSIAGHGCPDWTRATQRHYRPTLPRRAVRQDNHHLIYTNTHECLQSIPTPVSTHQSRISPSNGCYCHQWGGCTAAARLQRQQQRCALPRGFPPRHLLAPPYVQPGDHVLQSPLAATALPDRSRRPSLRIVWRGNGVGLSPSRMPTWAATFRLSACRMRQTA